MKKPSPPLALLLLSMFLASGCSDTEIRSAMQAVSDPSQLLYAYATVLTGVTVILWWFSSTTLWIALLAGVRYTSMVTLAASPLYYLAVRKDLESGIALALSGAVGLVITHVFLRDRKRAIPDDRRSPEQLYPPRGKPPAQA